MRGSTLLSLLVANTASAFPFVALQEGVDSTLLRRQQVGNGQQGGPDSCAYNPPEKHVPAAPVTAQFPYNNAKNGLKGNEKGGYLVPHPDDKEHEFRAPNYQTDIRGPCPGLNAAANHGFLARDGITTFAELVDAQQNLYNVGHDLAVLLAILGLTVTDGDIITTKLSIGCDATNRTSILPLLTGSQPGLNGHNKFEADTSLTRNDFFTHGGDNFKMNATLFTMMTESTGGLYNLDNLAKYRAERFDQSLAENPNFYFGPLSLLLFGAASFLYELMPSGPDYIPDEPTISSFFGAEKDAQGNYFFNGKERIPPNWTNRIEPYSIRKVGGQIFAMYGKAPRPFGGNTGSGQYNLIDYPKGYIAGGTFGPPDVFSVTCLLYQLATERVPSSLNGVLTPTVETLAFVLTKINPLFANLGCPLRLT